MPLRAYDFSDMACSELISWPCPPAVTFRLSMTTVELLWVVEVSLFSSSSLLPFHLPSSSADLALLNGFGRKSEAPHFMASMAISREAYRDHYDGQGEVPGLYLLDEIQPGHLGHHDVA
jgi:hypothetical protein